MNRRRGFTLVEMCIAGLIAIVVLIAVMSLLTSGSRLFASGQNAVRGPEAAVLLMDRLERDLMQVLQVPGDPRPPVAVGDGDSAAFYVPGAPGVLSTPRTVVGVPVWWELYPSENVPGVYHPVRNEKILQGVALLGWEFQLWSPGTYEDLPGWYVTVRARFQADNRRGEPYVYARAIYLRQPSTNLLMFPTFGHELNEDLVRMLPPPAFRGFDAIAPPKPEDLMEPESDPLSLRSPDAPAIPLEGATAP